MRLRSTMEIINTPDSSNNNSFAIKKFIKEGDKYYVLIQPHKTKLKIRIDSSDYHKGLRAYYMSKSINCYPINGRLQGDTFEEVIYEMELIDNL
jgi:hypothetical protein